ncbi:hypothetical protein JCM10449v2_004654 [Rhodotorula kratochvilovae]
MALLRPLRALRAPLKLLLFLLALLALYHLSPFLLSSAAAPSPASAYHPQKRAGQANAQFDFETEKRRWSEAHRMRSTGEDGDGEEADEAGAGERHWAAQAAEEGGPREWAPQGRAPPRRGAPARADRPAAGAGAPPLPQRQQGERQMVRPVAVGAQRKAEREAAAVRQAAADGDGGEGGAYEEELAAAEARKARQREKLREWDERMAQAEAKVQQKGRLLAGGRRPGAAAAGQAQGGAGDAPAAAGGAKRGRKKRPIGGGAVDDDGELDAAPRGAGAGRGGAPQRKKGPLIQVGGAQAAAGRGGDVEETLVQKQQAAVAAAAANERAGKGWDQRFKRPAQPVVPAEEGDPLPKVVEADGYVGADENDESPSLPPPANLAAKPRLFDHRLVARFAAFDYSLDGRPGSEALVIDPNAEDSFQLNSDDKPPRNGEGGGTRRYNLTVCALVPNENRFIGEWLLYHRLLGVERFALYDTSHPGAFGAAEVDALADRMQREGGGELGPTVEELKASVGTTDAGPDGLDEKGEIRGERIAGMERWIEQGVVRMHWLKFSDSKKARDFHSHMLDHCTATYGPSSNWLAHLDVDEFFSVSTGLYSADAPYRPEPASPWQYPLHDILARSDLADAACVPLPELNFRNLGVRELEKGQGVLETQTHRDVLKQGKKVVREEGLQQKTLIHTAFAETPIVHFAGPHSCEVSTRGTPPEGLSTEIRNSQGTLLQEGGLYEVAKLPIEPLAIAHYLQRDLRDCLSKLSSLSDPNDLHSKSRGILACEEHYLPSPSERRSLEDNTQNRFLLKTPPQGSVVEDARIATSWAAEAAREIRAYWHAAERVAAPAGGARLRGKGRMAPPPPPEGREAAVAAVPREVVERARRKVEVVTV